MTSICPFLWQVLLLAFASCVGTAALRAQEPFPDALRVDPLDDRNFSRSGVLPETQRLANFVETNCSALRQRLGGRLPTPQTEQTCLMPGALKDYIEALKAVAGNPPIDLDELDRRLRTGAILDGRRTRSQAARVATRYFVAKAFLVNALAATANLFEVWFPVGSHNFFSYVFPQVNSALARGTRMSSVLAFQLHVRCNNGPCGDPRLASVLAAAAKPVAMIRVADSKAVDSSGLLARSTLEPYTLVLRLDEALAGLRAVTSDPRLYARFIEGKADTPELKALDAAVASLRRQLEAAACWVSTEERQEALAWIDGRAAASISLSDTPQPQPPGVAPGTFLVEAAKETRTASTEISDRLIRLRAALSPVTARP